MKPRAIAALVLVAAVAWVAWSHELFTVARAGARPRPLAIHVAGSRAAAPPLDVVLPAVPVGMERLRAGDAPLLVHYWAPWQRHALAQAVALDSLRRSPELQGLRVVVVCFDPFPSVARYIARNRLRLSVLLDSNHELRQKLPCPSIPYTYVLDGAGRIAAAQEGEMAWLAPETRAALARMLAERRSPQDTTRRSRGQAASTSPSSLSSRRRPPTAALTRDVISRSSLRLSIVASACFTSVFNEPAFSTARSTIAFCP